MANRKFNAPDDSGEPAGLTTGDAADRFFDVLPLAKGARALMDAAGCESNADLYDAYLLVGTVIERLKQHAAFYTGHVIGTPINGGSS